MNSNILFNTNYLDSCVFSWNYKPTHTNITSLSKAQIIVLPEHHYSKNDQTRNAWIINRLYKEGDTVLVESPNDEPATFHQINKVFRPITIRGWDHSESDEALHTAKKPFYDLRKKLFNTEGFNNEDRQILLEAIEKGPLQTNEVFKKEFESNLDDFNFLSPDIKKMLLYRKIEIWHEKNGEIGKEIANTFNNRQASLIRKCQQFSKTNNRIFIIAGAAHILSQDNDQQIFKNGVKLLHDYLKEKQFVIFDHDRTPTKLLQADVKLCLMLSSIEKTVTKICGRASKIFFFFLILFTFPISLPCYVIYTRHKRVVLRDVQKL